MTIFTDDQAIREFFDIRGDELLDEADIAEAVSEIGNPDAYLHVARTRETVADFIANGWTHHHDEASGIVVLKRGKRTYANIADCGDYRLVYVET